jgi:hypothetical protein
MAKFNSSSGNWAEASLVGQTTGPVTAKSKKTTTLAEGGLGYKQGAKSELFLLAVSCMLGEPTFYESADDRLERITKLTHKVTKKDPEWVARFVPWLRNTANMRTVSLVVAVEYLVAGGPNARAVIDSAMSRADEPAEMLVYWMMFHDKRNPARFLKSPALPQALRKGIGDAVNRLWTEYSVLKYDTNSRKLSFADVLNLCHVRNKDEATGALFKYIIDTAYDREPNLTSLPKIEMQLAARQIPIPERREKITPELIDGAGFTWEQVSGWIGGELDGRIWDMLIPSMPYMATLRNLRNFDEKGVSKASVDYVIKMLSDPEAVAKSRQFPYRFYNAYKNTSSDNWRKALSDAMDLACQNLPAFEGSSLILVDTSGSMTGGWSRSRNGSAPYEIAALLGAALTQKARTTGGKVDIVLYDDAKTSRLWNIPAGGSILRAVDDMRKQCKGGWTQTWETVDRWYKGHDRVIILTDEQTSDQPSKVVKSIPFLHIYNLNGYPSVSSDTSKPGRYRYGGFSDACFTLMATLEQYSADWPF